MVWFKVDDRFYDHPKTRKAGKSAVGVWLLCGTWSAHHETDGFVPRTIFTRFGSKNDANRLLTERFLEEEIHEGERGYRIKNWSEYQPTKAENQARREVKAQVGRAGGLASARSRREARCLDVGEATAQANGSAVAQPKPNPEPEPVPVPLENLFVGDPADAASDEDKRDDVERICTLLADRIEANGVKRPTITKAWRRDARLLIDKDGHPLDRIEWIINWVAADEFWKSNILSMPKLRSKYDQLVLRSRPDRASASPARLGLVGGSRNPFAADDVR